MPHTAKLSREMRECIQNCQECHSVCTETTAYCLEKGGRHAEANHVTLLLDCAQICAASADFMLRMSQFHGRVCDVCAAICLGCADSCERVAPADTTMKLCADVCRRCADSCRRMAEATV